MAYDNSVFFGKTTLNDLTVLNNVHITNVKLDRVPQIIVGQGKLARQDGVKVFNKQYGERYVYVEGYITTSEKQDLMSARTSLLSKLNGTEQTLRIIYKQLPLDFTATVSNVVFEDTTGGYTTFSIEFICSEPTARDRDYRVLINDTSVTTASEVLGFSEQIAGSYLAPANLVVGVPALTGGSSAYVQLSNQAGELIKITRDWVAGDVLTIDTFDKTCKVNGSAVDYTGTFWQLSVGDSQIDWADSFTTRTATVLMKYKRRYL